MCCGALFDSRGSNVEGKNEMKNRKKKRVTGGWGYSRRSPGTFRGFAETSWNGLCGFILSAVQSEYTVIWEPHR